MIYLASPYSAPEPGIRTIRYKEVLRLTAQLLFQKKTPVFSPIVYGHHMSTEFALGFDADFWWGFNSAMLRKSDALYMACLPDWQYSKGMAQELEFAETLQLPITYIDKFGTKIPDRPRALV